LFHHFKVLNKMFELMTTNLTSKDYNWFKSLYLPCKIHIWGLIFMDKPIVFSRMFGQMSTILTTKAKGFWIFFQLQQVDILLHYDHHFCSLPRQLQSITFAYGRWPRLCYFLNLFLNVIKIIQRLIHNAPFLSSHPSP